MKYLIRIIIMVTALCGASLTQKFWDFTPAAHKEVMKGKDLPPTLYMSSVALGPIRGIISNGLWMRAEDKQRSKEFHEAVQLTEWIAQMQPRVPSVWIYLGWNMSYNISHEYSDREERWQWILRGLQLMMDDGMKMNPESIAIRTEIARVLFDKIGRAPDIEGQFFNQKWTELMLVYFDTSAPGEIELLAQAPDYDDFINSDYVQKVIDSLKDADSNPLNIRKFPPHNRVFEHLPENSSAFEFYSRAYWSWRKKRIEEELFLDLDHILTINKKFGPFDWRLHHAHVMYWLIPDVDTIDIQAGTHRTKMVRQNLQDAFFKGMLRYNPQTQRATKSSNPFVVPHIFETYRSLFDEAHAIAEPSKKDIENYYHLQTSFKAFLKSAFGVMYLNGRTADAQIIYDIYKKQYLSKNTTITFDKFILVSLDDPDALEYREQAHAKVQSLLNQSFASREVNDMTRAQRFEEIARRLHRTYMKKWRSYPKKALPPYKSMLKATQDKYKSSIPSKESVPIKSNP